MLHCEEGNYDEVFWIVEGCRRKSEEADASNRAGPA